MELWCWYTIKSNTQKEDSEMDTGILIEQSDLFSGVNMSIPLESLMVYGGLFIFPGVLFSIRKKSYWPLIVSIAVISILGVGVRSYVRNLEDWAGMIGTSAEGGTTLVHDDYHPVRVECGLSRESNQDGLEQDNSLCDVVALDDQRENIIGLFANIPIDRFDEMGDIEEIQCGRIREYHHIDKREFYMDKVDLVECELKG